MATHVFTNLQDLDDFCNEFKFSINGFRARGLGMTLPATSIEDIYNFDCEKYGGIYELDIYLLSSDNKKVTVRYNCYNEKIKQQQQPSMKIGNINQLSSEVSNEVMDDDDELFSLLDEINTKLNNVLLRLDEKEKIGAVAEDPATSLINTLLTSPAVHTVIEHFLKDKNNLNDIEPRQKETSKNNNANVQ